MAILLTLDCGNMTFSRSRTPIYEPPLLPALFGFSSSPASINPSPLPPLRGNMKYFSSSRFCTASKKLMVTDCSCPHNANLLDCCINVQVVQSMEEQIAMFLPFVNFRMLINYCVEYYILLLTVSSSLSSLGQFYWQPRWF